MKKTTDCKELALKKVNISGNVIGKFGTFEIEQTFVNNTKKVFNGLNIAKIKIMNKNKSNEKKKEKKNK